MVVEDLHIQNLLEIDQRKLPRWVDQDMRACGAVPAEHAAALRRAVSQTCADAEPIAVAGSCIASAEVRKARFCQPVLPHQIDGALRQDLHALAAPAAAGHCIGKPHIIIHRAAQSAASAFIQRREPAKILRIRPADAAVRLLPELRRERRRFFIW